MGVLFFLNMNPCWRWFLAISMVLLTSSCGQSSQPASQALTTARVVTPTQAALGVATATAGRSPREGWQRYQSDQAAYSIDYPANWTMMEQTGGDGTFTTTFTSVDGRASVIVMVGGTQLYPADDLPNVRCEQVVVGGISGMRCLDTIALITSTVLMGAGKTFTIVASGTLPDPQIYQQMLDSFAVCAALCSF